MDRADLEIRLEALQAEITELRSELARADDLGESANVVTAVDEVPDPLAAASAPRGGPSRRALLGGAVAGAAAAVTGALAVAQPAAATTGAMQYGAANNAGSAATTLTSAGSPALGVTNSGGGAAIVATGSTGSAIDATASGGRGVNVSTTSGIGVWSQTTSGIAGVFWTDSGGGVEIVANRWQLWLRADGRAAPTADTVDHYEGEIVMDGNQDVWVCIENGTPGTWRKLGGGSAAGAFHLLPAPVRIYDSRAGSTPAVGTKAPLAAGESRVLDASVNSSGVPVGATGLALTCMVVNAAAGSGNFTVWADGVAKPAANTMVWGGSDGRHSTTALTAVSASRKVKVSSSLKTDVVVDVLGYYR